QVLELAAPAQVIGRCANRLGCASLNSPPEECDSGTGLPHSKTLARFSSGLKLRQVLECAAPAALFGRRANRLKRPSLNSPPQQSESGTAHPHSKTLARFSGGLKLRQVLECAAPAALFGRGANRLRRPSLNSPPQQSES